MIENKGRLVMALLVVIVIEQFNDSNNNSSSDNGLDLASEDHSGLVPLVSSIQKLNSLGMIVTVMKKEILMDTNLISLMMELKMQLVALLTAVAL
jgi:hypothetical protein